MQRPAVGADALADRPLELLVGPAARARVGVGGRIPGGAAVSRRVSAE
jgi:hypothetical protein